MALGSYDICSTKLLVCLREHVFELVPDGHVSLHEDGPWLATLAVELVHQLLGFGS